MVITFDHLVHFTINPEEAKASFEKLGFLAVNGGQHLDWGTYNSLSYFQHLRYIEWIGFKDFEKAVQSDNILIQQIVKDDDV